MNKQLSRRSLRNLRRVSSRDFASSYNHYRAYFTRIRPVARPVQVTSSFSSINRSPSPSVETNDSTLILTLPNSPPPRPHSRSPSPTSSIYEYKTNRLLDFLEYNEYLLSPLHCDFEEYLNHINDYLPPEVNSSEFTQRKHTNTHVNFTHTHTLTYIYIRSFHILRN